MKKRHRDLGERMKTAAALGWEASPVTTARLSAELYNAIKGENWALADSDRIAGPNRLLPTSQYHQIMGGSGSARVAYSAPGSVGVAISNSAKGILTGTH